MKTIKAFLTVLVLGGFSLNTFAKDEAYTYVVTESTGPSSLDPLDADQTNNLPVARMIYATPLEIDGNDKISSLVLSSYNYDPKSKKVEWVVKNDTKYSDGTLITPEDVAFSVARMAYARPKFPVLEYIEGLTEWVSLKTPLFSLPKGIAVNGSKVTIQLTKDLNHPLFRFTLEIFAIIPKKCVDLSTNKITCDKIPTSGRYEIISKADTEIKFLKRNDISEKIPAQLSFKYIPAINAIGESKNFNKNTIMAGNEVMYSSQDINVFKGSGNTSFLPASRFAILQLNPNTPAFKEKLCRQVFADLFRKNFKSYTKDQVLVESSIFTKIVTGYMPSSELENNKPKLTDSQREECYMQMRESGINWGYIETEKNQNFVSSMLATLKEIGVKSIEPQIFQKRSDIREALIANKLSLVNGGSGFWALDPSGDLQMLFTPNLHQTLNTITNDDELQRLIKNVRDNSNQKEPYNVVNQYLYNDAKFNIYSHVRRFYFSKNKDLLKRAQFGFSAPAPWQVFE